MAFIIKCFKDCGFHKIDTNVNEAKELETNIEELENISKIIGINLEFQYLNLKKVHQMN